MTYSHMILRFSCWLWLWFFLKFLISLKLKFKTVLKFYMRAGVGGLDWLRGDGRQHCWNYVLCMYTPADRDCDFLPADVLYFALCYNLKFTTVTCAGKFESYWRPDGKLLRRTTKTEDVQTSLNWSAVRVMSIRQQGRLQLHIPMDCSTVLTVCKRLCNSPPSHPPFCV